MRGCTIQGTAAGAAGAWVRVSRGVACAVYVLFLAKLIGCVSMKPVKGLCAAMLQLSCVAAAMQLGCALVHVLKLRCCVLMQPCNAGCGAAAQELQELCRCHLSRLLQQAWCSSHLQQAETLGHVGHIATDAPVAAICLLGSDNRLTVLPVPRYTRVGTASIEDWVPSFVRPRHSSHK